MLSRPSPRSGIFYALVLIAIVCLASMPATAQVIGTIPVGTNPYGVAVDSANGDIYVANGTDNTVSVINGATNTVIATIPVGRGPIGVAVDSANGDIYVANGPDGTVSVINGATNTVIATVPVGNAPFAVAVDSANDDIYVTNYSDNTVSVINGATNTVITTVSVGANPYGVAVDSANGDIYVTDSTISAVSVISGATNTLIVGALVGASPQGVAVDSANGDIYVANDADNTVSVMNGATNTVITTIPVGVGPVGVAVDSANGDIYVANGTDNTVSVINGATNTVVATVPVAAFPYGVAVDSANGDIYVTNYGANNVSVIVPLITATLTITTAGTLNTINVLTQGAPNQDFKFASGGTCAVGTSYNVGDTCTVFYTFTAQYPGNRFGGIVLADSSNNVLATKYISGTGNGPLGLFTSATPTFSVSGLFIPRGLSADGFGNIYVLETGNGNVDKIAAGTHAVTTITNLGSVGGGATAVDGAGNLFVSSSAGQTIYELVGAQGAAIPVATIPSSPDDNLEVDGAGNLYFSTENDGSIWEITASDVASAIASGSGSAPVNELFTGDGTNRFVGMAVDITGNLFAPDFNNNILFELPAGSSTLTTLVPSSPTNGMFQPHAIAVDPAGNIYITNANGSQNVLRYAVGTYTLTTLPSMGSRGVVIDGAGNLYTILHDDATVSGFTRTAGPSLSFVSTPLGATRDSGTAIEFENDGNADLTISNYSATGPFAVNGSANTCAAGTMHSGATCLVGAVFAPVSSGPQSGSAVITDNSAGSPQTVSLSGTAPYIAPATSVGNTSATQTVGVTFGANVTLNSNASIAVQVVTQGATGLDFNLVSGGTCAAGASYTTGQSCTVEYSFTPKAPGLRLGAIVLVDNSGNAIDTFISGVGQAPVGAFDAGTQSTFLNIGDGGQNALTFDAAGNMYYSDLSNGSMYKVPAGTSTATPFATGLATPSGIAVDGAGNVYYADYGSNAVYVLPADGAAITQVETPANPECLAVDMAGNLFIAVGGSTQVEELFSDGTKAFFGTGLNHPQCLVVDNSDNIYLTDRDGLVLQITPSNTQNTLASGFGFPIGIDRDPAGNLYVADLNANTINKLPAGSYSTPIPLGSGWNTPKNLAIDPTTGNLYVADAGSTSVIKLDRSAVTFPNFPTTSFGAVSSPTQTGFDNIGNVPLAISSLTASTNFASDASTTCGTGNLAPASPCTLAVDFAPSAVGTFSETFTVADNSFSSATQTIALNGTSTQASTSTTVASSSNQSVWGQSVTFTATVTDTSTASAAQPTGSVQFVVDGSNFGSPIALTGAGSNSSSAISTATASLSIAGSPHTVAANYVNADGNFSNSSGSLSGGQTVNKADTATTVTSSMNPSVFGQSVTFTATVSAVAPGSGTPIGTVIFLDGGSPIGTGTLIGGIATFTTSALAVGNHTITTSYGGDGNFNGSTGPLTGNPQVVNKADTATTVTSSLNPSVFGQSVTFTATVSAVAPGAGTPTGTVTFLDGGSPIGTGTLLGGVATFTTSALAGGNHTVTTSYGGDGNFNGSTGSLTGNPQVVNKANTATTVTSSANPSIFGQFVTFTATVSAVAPGSGTPIGAVIFLDGGSPIGTGTLIGGIATFTTSALAVGNHTITTSYGGDGNFNGSTGSLTGNPQVVNKADTVTTVTSSANPSVFGQSVTFTAAVSAVAPGSGTPTGTVTFLDGGISIGTGTLSGGIATFTTSSLALGNHTITTLYSGDGNFNGSTGSLTGNPQGVDQANTTTTVTSSAGTITLGDTVTFTATVTANSPGTGVPTGLVTFFDGTTPIGSGPLNGSGQVTFSTAVLAVGSDSITAIYHGDANFTASPLSAAATETVNLRGTTASISPNPTTVAVGEASTTTVTITDGGASTPPGTADTFAATGAPVTGRTGFTSTLIADGGVLIAGGTDANGNVLNTAEAYTVSGATFTATPGNLHAARTGAVAVLLPTGGVLIAGGSSDGTAAGALNTAELLIPLSGTFAVAGSGSGSVMTAARFGATATLLNSGKVLIAGGINSGGVLNSAELYDPASDTFTATGNLKTARTGASATLLGNGMVLVAGGSSDGTANGALTSAELFDPTSNGGAGSFTAITGSNSTLASGRWQPESTLLPNGKVLVAGGQSSTKVLDTADLYDPVANAFTVSNGVMSQARSNGSAVALPNGAVLLAGGTTNPAADLYDAEGDQFVPTGSALQSDNGLVSTLLNNGQVLVIGLTTAATPASDAELYSPSFHPFGTVGFTSSDVTDVFGSPCVLVPSGPTASTCTSTVTPAEIGASPHSIAGNYPADAIHSGASNAASLTVIATAPPTIAKAFGASNVAQNSTTNVSFTIVNPNPAATLTGISFTDALPAGLVVANPNNLNSNCGGTFTAVSGSSSMSLTGGTVAPAGSPPQIVIGKLRNQKTSLNPPASGECVITVDLLVTGTGTISNTTGPISANESGPGSTSNTASINVFLAPTVSKAFGASSIPLNGTTSLNFNIANPNSGAFVFGGSSFLYNIAFSDTLPSGLVIATPNGLTSTCSGSTISANAGGNAIGLSALNLNGASSCSFSVNVTGTVVGMLNNTTTPVTATFDDGSGLFRPITGGTASASIAVLVPPILSESFVPQEISLGGVSALTFTITSVPNNTVAETGVAFSDTLPANVVVATPNGATGTCNGGTLTAVAGSGSISLTGGTIAGGAHCTVSVNVTSSVYGSYTNTTGAVTSTNGGTGNTASATLDVAAASLSITKTHVGNFPQSGSGTYTITVSDSASAGPTDGTTVTVTDSLPNVFTATAMSGTGWTCALATLTCTRTDVLAPGASYPPISLTVSVQSSAPASATNTATVTGGSDPNTHTATDPTQIGPPLQISSVVNYSGVNPGGNAVYTLNVTSAAVLGTINLACSGLPQGVTCNFNPPTITPGTTQVTLTISTTGPTAKLSPLRFGKTGPMFALILPLGVVMIGFGGRKNWKKKWGLAMLGALLALVAITGCGGNTPNTSANATPAGSYSVTVKATSSANPSIQASTTVILTVH